MRAVWILALVLAGCAADAPPVAPDDDIPLDDDLEATRDTGVIRGAVVDTSIVPLANATVVLLATGAETTTNADGAFGFSRVPPGLQMLDVTKQGYESIQVQTTVVAGVERPDAVLVMLPANPSTAPRVVPYHFSGHLGCSLSYIALCGLPVVSGLTDDAFLAEFELEGPPQWVNMEALWSGTQPTGDQMNINMGGTPAGPQTTCCTAQGPSPLLVFANETELAEYDIGSGENLIGRLFAWEMEGTGIDDHTGMCVPVVVTTYCQGPGMALDQDFEFLVHVFYNWVPEEGWRFTMHGDPVPPR